MAVSKAAQSNLWLHRSLRILRAVLLRSESMLSGKGVSLSATSFRVRARPKLTVLTCGAPQVGHCFTMEGSTAIHSSSRTLKSPSNQA